MYAKAGLTLSCAAILALVVLSLKRGERGGVVVSHSVFSVAQELAQEGDAEAKKATLSSAVNLQPPLNLEGAENEFPNISAAHGEAKEIQEENPALNPSVVGQSGSKSSITSLSGRFPRIMIVGFGKTGTKALFEMLKMHPDLCGPAKEKRFFSDHYNKGLFYYLNSLPEPPSGGLVVEKSPDYILDNMVASRITASTERLKINVTDLRFIVVLREPINRAMSEYLEWNVNRVLSGKKKLPFFHTMVVHESNGSVNDRQPFIRASRYSEYVTRWFHHFSRTQTCFVDGDRFVQDPFFVIHELEQCLRLRPFFTSENFVFNSKKGFYCFRPSKSQSDAHCMNGSKGRKHPDIPDKVLASLKSYYAPLDAQLEELVGRKMQWQSESIIT